jgi:hypothetical protein
MEKYGSRTPQMKQAFARAERRFLNKEAFSKDMQKVIAIVHTISKEFKDISSTHFEAQTAEVYDLFPIFYERLQSDLRYIKTLQAKYHNSIDPEKHQSEITVMMRIDEYLSVVQSNMQKLSQKNTPIAHSKSYSILEECRKYTAHNSMLPQHFPSQFELRNILQDMHKTIQLEENILSRLIV